MNERSETKRPMMSERGGWLNRRAKISLLAGVAGVGLLANLVIPFTAHAKVIEIFYDSFESPDVATYSNSSVPPGWVKESVNSGMWDTAWNTNWITTAYGTQGIKCYSTTGFYTTNITETLQPGATYTLSFNVGNTRFDTGEPYGGLSYTGAILAGTNVVGSVTGTTSTDTMTTTNVVIVTTTAAQPHLGKALRIRLRDSGTNFRWQTLFDNVRLTVDETSEYKQTVFFGE